MRYFTGNGVANGATSRSSTRRLSHTFQPLFAEFKAEPPSRVTFSMGENGGVVRLTVIHESFPEGSKVLRACSDGWPMILSSLKTLLETGASLPTFTFHTQDERFQRAGRCSRAGILA